MNKASHHRNKRVIFGCLVSLLAWGWGTQGVRAEGSRELVANGGNRPYTDWRSDTYGGITRRTILKVYAKANEVVNLGSSAVGVDSGNILVFSETANVDSSTALLNCKTAQAGKGKLDTSAKESIGPLPATGGYTPCTFSPSSDGIYQVVFYGPRGQTSATDPDSVGSGNPISSPLTDRKQGSSVAMWDVTVRSSLTSTQTITGRVFADYVALNMGANGRSLKTSLYILTLDGYRYVTDLNGLDPYGFIFFANDRGLLTADGQTLYHSAIAADPTNNAVTPLKGGVTLQAPMHKIFFNIPDNSTLDRLGIPRTPAAPGAADGFQFTGGSGGSGNQTPKTVGGTFSFNAPQSGSYKITIDTNDNGLFLPSEGDRVLEGQSLIGSNVVLWDGRDGLGNAVAPLPGNAAYDAQITLRGGEYHFPLLDAEGNPNGIIISMDNAPGSFPPGISKTTLYFDERAYSTNGVTVNLGCNALNQVCDGRDGINSAFGAHNYPGGATSNGSSGYGDKKAIDTWIYFPSQAKTAKLVITDKKQANVSGRKSIKFLTDTDNSGTLTVGDIVEYTITYVNQAPTGKKADYSDATQFTVSDDLPAQLTFLDLTVNAPTGSGISKNAAYGGTGALTNSTGTLAVDDAVSTSNTVTVRIKARVESDNNAAPISNQASATFGTPDSPDTTATVITDADSAGSATDKPAVGGTVMQVDDTKNQGNNPTKPDDDDPTLFKVYARSRLRLVKRITAINGDRITTVIDPNTTAEPDDNAAFWPAGYLQGAIDNLSPTVNLPAIPNDVIEYTIYFLSDGGQSAANVNICDLIPTNTLFDSTAFNSGTSGLALALGSTTPTLYPTNSTTDGDGSGYFSANTAPTPCRQANGAALTATDNPNGAIVVNVTPSIPLTAATAAGTANSYGFIRFRVKIQ